MKIYRTNKENTGHYLDRLFDAIEIARKIAANYQIEDFLSVIDAINDHKGELNIILNTELDKYEMDHYYDIFYSSWHIFGETNVSIYYNDTCLIGYQFRNQ